MVFHVLMLNGPNLNLLGTREPEIYGHATLQDIEKACVAEAQELSIKLECRQSNHEGELIDWIQESRGVYDALILNAGAFSHTSIAILDALKALTIPLIEVHLSNIYLREAFRHHSYVSSVATGVICGLGAQGYSVAIEWLGKHLQQSPAPV